ncbi:MAG TPA: FAD-linked oxidase C-terminal domain-containing protein [Galbitalea sp.]|jgi:glycolate oxidase|nr:FAD-linked oxidase C-terminal domain-containing protein [Galbitalea sp.]
MIDGVETIELLRNALGEVVSTNPADLDAARADKSGRVSDARPLAIVNARTVEDVQATMRIAFEHSIPVVPRGAGTGLAGGAIGGAGEIVLSTLAMKSILEVNADDELAVVQPGILNEELNDQLARHGLWFAPDPASKAISSVGGNIATNAGGLLCAKYGVTREAVLGLKVVLSDGRLMSLGHRTVKGVTGYDLTALVIGSEGTLGIIVEATLKLRPLPFGEKATIGAYFATIEQAAAASAGITAARLRPAAMELIGESALVAIGTLLGLDLGTRGSYLLVQFDGQSAPTEAEAAVLIIRSQGGDAETTTDEIEGERLFAIRRAFHPAMETLGTVLIEDVAVPRSQLPAMFVAITEIEKKYDCVIPTVAHAGDGNLHPNFIFDGVDVPAEVWSAADELFVACLKLGGTLTGEHGVGLLKKRWLRDELGDDQVDLQFELKRVFDPRGILNPGKIF